MNNESEYIPHNHYREYTPDEMQQRAKDFYQDVRRRRTVREFSEKPIPEDVMVSEGCRNSAQWCQSAALAFCGGGRPRGQTPDSRSR